MIAFLLLLTASQGPVTPAVNVKDAREQQRNALAACKSQDWPHFLAAATCAAEMRPQHPGLLMLRASAEALSGKRQAARSSLRRAADAGYATELTSQRGLGERAEDADFLLLAERMRANGEPLVASSEALIVSETTLFAEGVTAMLGFAARARP